MSGNNVLYGAGMLECGMVVDFPQLLLDSDIIEMVKFFLGGVEVNDETLCVDEVRENGCDSNFLMSPTTLKLMRTQSRPQFFQRMNRSTWISAGKPDPYDMANEKVKDILVRLHPGRQGVHGDLIAGDEAGHIDDVRVEIAMRSGAGLLALKAPEQGRVRPAPILEVGSANVEDRSQPAGLHKLMRQGHCGAATIVVPHERSTFLCLLRRLSCSFRLATGRLSKE